MRSAFPYPFLFLIQAEPPSGSSTGRLFCGWGFSSKVRFTIETEIKAGIGTQFHESHEVSLPGTKELVFVLTTPSYPRIYAYSASVRPKKPLVKNVDAAIFSSRGTQMRHKSVPVCSTSFGSFCWSRTSIQTFFDFFSDSLFSLLELNRWVDCLLLIFFILFAS